MEVADQIVLLILVKGLSGVNILIGHLSGVGVDVQRSRQACIDLHDWRSTNVHECTEESVYHGCTCAHTCHVYIDDSSTVHMEYGMQI